ncbi:MAG: HD domain-containing protein, partial [Melioribacteraceae bacterium]|nr:HD domain-containing protein [Melioribacteraceae bacterium]
FEEHKPLVCVLDINLPGTDGISLLEQIMDRDPTSQAIMLTGYGNVENITKALRRGACDFLLKPVNFEILLHAINKCYDKVDLLKMREDYQKELEAKVQKKTELIKKGLYETIRTLSRVTRFRDPYTQHHEERVVKLSKAIAKKMGYTVEQLEALEIAAILHDVGKIAVPAEILVKPTKPTEKERGILEEHVVSSYHIIKDIPFQAIVGLNVAEVVYQHHERIDGSGYPRNLKDEEMLDEAKIIAVADIVESMSSHRPYRAAIPMVTVVDEIVQNRGKTLKAECVNACLEVLRDNNFKIENIV